MFAAEFSFGTILDKLNLSKKGSMRTTTIKNTSKREVFEAIQTAFKAQDYVLVDKDMQEGYLLAQKQLSPFTFAKELLIDVIPTGNDSIRLLIQMRSIGIQVMNWEINRKCERLIAMEIKRTLALNEKIISLANRKAG